MKEKAILVILLVTLFFLYPSPVKADGIIIPNPPPCEPGRCPPPPCFSPLPCPPISPIIQLAIRYHRVQVTIQDQVAITHVDQVFYNPNDWQVEGTYVFPIPIDAAVSSFTLWIDGQPVEGKVLDADEARQTYEDIVNKLRDPALLEYSGRGAVQASIFPIPPRGERRIELEYTQALTAENGLVRYTYPLNTEKFSIEPIEEVSIHVDISSSTAPIRAVYSPSHAVDVSRESNFHIIAGYEETNTRPDSDFSLVYSLGDEQAFHLLTFRDPADPADPDGFFLLMLAPQPGKSGNILPKDVILVLDRSGSMEGEKFQQARQALQYILEHLNPDDRFNIISFSTGMESYARGLRYADEANEASAWVDRLSAEGSTDINRALLEAAAIVDAERPAYLIFLTDGLPTEGVVDSQRILDNFNEATMGNLRLFAFGVGYDVDTFLLDSLAQDHHGTSTYVQPGERLDEILSTFYSKISAPVMTDLELDFGVAGAYDIFPNPLPDLFSGSQIIVTGRYRQPGEADVNLMGVVNGEMRQFDFRKQNFSAQPGRTDLSAALPRLWATRKIGYLLNQVRLNGPDGETIDQIVRLSIRFGIVTPYTSYLVTEVMPLGVAEQSRIAREQLNLLQSLPAAPVSGEDAVQKAADQGALAGADAPAPSTAEAANIIRLTGSHTFVFTDGRWVDTAFDPDTMTTIKVPFLSDDYFALAQAYPELATGFALGLRVIALSHGAAYEVVEQGESTGQIEIPAAPAPETPTPTRTPDPGGVVSSSPTGTLSSQANQLAESNPVGCLGGLLPLIVLFPIGIFFLFRRG